MPLAVVSVIPLEGLPELEPEDDLGLLLHGAATAVGGLEDGDVVVVAQKAVSKVEGRVVSIEDVEPSARAVELAGPDGDPRHVEVILRESAEVVRSRPPLVITETRHGSSVPRRASTRRTRRATTSSSCSRSTRTSPRVGSASACASCRAPTSV